MPAKSVHAFSAMLRQGATDGIQASHLRLKPRVGAWHFDMIWAPINAKPFRHRTAIQKLHCRARLTWCSGVPSHTVQQQLCMSTETISVNGIMYGYHRTLLR